MTEDIIVKIDASDPIPLFGTNKFLRKYLGGSCRVIPNKNDYTITIEGSTKTDVEIAMQKYMRVYSTSHGKCDFGYKLECLETTKEQEIRDEIRREYEYKITSLTVRKEELKQKWGKEREKHRNEIENQKGLLKNERYTSKQLKEQHNDARSEIGNKKHEIGLLNSELEDLQREFDDYNKTPIYELFLKRFKKFVRK